MRISAKFILTVIEVTTIFVIPKHLSAQVDSRLDGFPPGFYINYNQPSYYSGSSVDVIMYKGDTIYDDFEFRNVVIHCPIDVQGKVFKGNVNFDHVTFMGKVFLRNSKFLKKVSFVSNDFMEWLYLEESIFSDTVVFEGTRWHMGTDFSRCLFNTQARFRNTTFYAEGYFNKTVFSGLTTFLSADFRNETFFNNTVLPDTLILSQVNANLEIDLSLTLLNSESKKCLLNISGTDTKALKLNFFNFKLLFDSNLNDEQKTSIYVGMLDKLKSEGLLESHKYLDIDYHKFQNIESKTNKPFTIRVSYKIQDWLQEQWWNYGYDKSKIVYNTILLLLLFTAINIFLFDYLVNKVYCIENLKEKRDSQIENRIEKKGIRSFLRVIPLSLLYSSMIFLAPKIEFSKLKLSNWFAVVYLLSFYFIGLICFAYLVNYIFTLK